MHILYIHHHPHAILIRLGSRSAEKAEFSKDCTAKKYGKTDLSSDLPYSNIYILFNALICIQDVFFFFFLKGRLMGVRMKTCK